jgi:hypothetical protein
MADGGYPSMPTPGVGVARLPIEPGPIFWAAKLLGRDLFDCLAASGRAAQLLHPLMPRLGWAPRAGEFSWYAIPAPTQA